MTNWIKALARRILGKELRLLRDSLESAERENILLQSEVNRKITLQMTRDGLECHRLREENGQLRQHNSVLSQQLSDRPHITEYKITKEIYQKHIVDKVPGALMNSTVTAQHTGYLLGVQATLNVVRELVQ